MQLSLGSSIVTAEKIAKYVIIHLLYTDRKTTCERLSTITRYAGASHRNYEFWNRWKQTGCLFSRHVNNNSYAGKLIDKTRR